MEEKGVRRPVAPSPLPVAQPVPGHGGAAEQQGVVGGPFLYPNVNVEYASFASAAIRPHVGIHSAPYAGEGPFVASGGLPGVLSGGAASPYAGLPSHRDISFGSQPSASSTTGPKERGKRKGGSGGLNKVCGVSPALQKIVGEPTMARTEIVKQLWAYIRKNNLQDPTNKRNIICNDELRLVFETDCTDMFKMNKLLSKHILALDTKSQNAKKLKSDSPEVDPAADSDDVYKLPMAISENLASFLGTGQREMLYSEASMRVWEHIKENKLEDPANAMVILCDSKLQQLFGCESISALGVAEMMKRHMMSRS